MIQRLGALAILTLTVAGCVAPSETTTAARPSAAAPAPSGSYPMVGGAAMLPSRTIVQNAVNSKDHTLLVRAVQAAGLADTLSSAGPYTVFAPTNAAFDKLPPGTLDSLLLPPNKSLLTNILTYHVVPGSKTAAQIAADIRVGAGTATYMTVAGDTLRARMDGNAIVLSDAKGNRSRVTQSDVMQSNGVIHVVDTILFPG